MAKKRMRGEVAVDSPAPPEITVASCVPKQLLTPRDKLKWLDRKLGESGADLFLLPQEWFGGHWVHKLSGGEMPLHFDRGWLEDEVGALAQKRGAALGVGACVKVPGDEARGTEDYLYFGRDGRLLGHHRKFCLPRYDDVRAAGAGRLWPETSWKARVQPVAIPELNLRVGTIFCWEVFCTTLVPAYSLARTNLVAHPIKFAPRGWLKTQVIDEEQHIVGFSQAPKSQEWVDRLKMLARHEALCPIAISCNTWGIGPKYLALGGHIDEVMGTTALHEPPSVPETDLVHTFKMKPAIYLDGSENTFSAGAFKEATGSIDGFGNFGPLTMHLKTRRLEAYLINDTTKFDVLLKEQALRTKASTHRRAAARGLTEQAAPDRTKQRGFFE